MYLATVQDLRDEGVPPSVSDARITELIQYAEEYIERRCKWWFEPRTLTLQMDGNGRPYLFLPAPILSITSVTISQPYSGFSADQLELAQLKLYNRVPWANGKDDRWNPKIEFNPAPLPSLLVQGDLSTRRLPVFTEGKQNVTIVGSFGFVEQSGAAPISVRMACRRLVIANLPRLADPAADDAKRAKLIQSESTDGHSYSLQNVGFGAGFLGDPEIDRALWRYTKPNYIGSTRD